jgi:RNA polymerase sigma-70 factor (ECF subfamily)
MLVLRCQAGDDLALKVLIERWQPRLARLAWRLTAEREAAKDVVQETWLAVVRRLKRLDDPARFGPWAYRILANKCADWVRRRVVRRNAADQLQQEARSREETSTGELHSGDGGGDMERLREVMKRLPDQQRAMLSLHYLDGMRIAEIAGVMNVPPGTVKSRLHHARNRLKDELERVKT